MNGFLIIFVGVIYLMVGLNYLFMHKYGLSITFIAYAIANYGLYLVGR